MICIAKLGLREDLYIVQKARIFNKVLYVRYVYLIRSSIFMRDKPISSSERMFHRDYDNKGSVEKRKSVVVILKKLGSKKNRSAANRQS
jgi:hypothetical protein